MNLGCGLFGAAYEIEKDMWGSLKKYRDAGFTAVEPFYGRKNMVLDSAIPSHLRSIIWREQEVAEYQPRLRALGLEISSMHMFFDIEKELEERLHEMMEFADKTGIYNFMISFMFHDYEKMKKSVELLNRMQEIVSGTNIQICYHNHAEEFAMVDEKKCWMDYFMEELNPDTKLEVDTGWVMYGGGDVLAFMEKYKDRIAAVHLKDFVKGFQRIKREDAFSAIGYGVLPVEKILDISLKLNLIEHGIMIDQDSATKGTVLAEDLKKGAELVLEILRT